MKKILLLFISFSAFSQNYKEKIDDFTGSKIIECSTYKQDAMIASTIAKEYLAFLKLYAEINKNGNKVIFLSLEIATPRVHCFSKEGKITFLLSDGSQVSLNQISDLKCDTNNVINYFIYDSDLTNLVNNNIEKIRVVSSEGYIDLTIKEKETINKRYLHKI